MKEELSHGTSDEQERLENMKELVTLATKYDMMPQGAGLEKLLEDASLSSDQDTLMHKSKGVRLMTVHASKGLEFKYVFISGLEQDLFPHIKDRMKRKEDTEEERRLFYVAVTRAREELYVICEPETFEKGIVGQRVKGNTLAEKAEFFKGKLESED